MAHPTKVKKDNGNNGIPTMYDINGSANFYNKADFGIIVHRDREKGNTLIRVEKVKFRHLGQGGECRFKFNTDNGRYAPWREDGQPIAWDMENLIIRKRDGQITQPELPQEIPRETAQLNYDPFRPLPVSNEVAPF